MMKIYRFILVIVVLACVLATRLCLRFSNLWQPSQAVVRGYLHSPLACELTRRGTAAGEMHFILLNL